MKKLIISILMSVFLASLSPAAAGPQSVVVDIVGSIVEDTEIGVPAASSIDLEIIGSSAKNTKISAPRPVGCISCCCPASCPTMLCDCNAACDVELPTQQHLGVDAWYGTFWYTPFDHLPKWPQI